MAKFYIRILLLTVVMISAVIYAFYILGSPFQIRAERIDRTRVNNISSLKSAIDSYYTKYKKLPGSLDELFTDSFYSYYKQYSQDPETRQQYNYSINTPASYELCASFSTETNKENASTPNSSSFNHPKGYYCFDLKISTDAIITAAGTNKRYVIQSTSLAHTSTASGSARTGIIPALKQQFADPHIQSVTTNLYSYYSSVSASEGKYSANASYPTGFFSNNYYEWGLISNNGAPVTTTIKFKNPVRLKSVTSDFTPGCSNYWCIEWKVTGITTNNYNLNLYSGYGGVQPDKASISVPDLFTEINITASTTSAHEIGFLYWRKITFEYSD